MTKTVFPMATSKMVPATGAVMSMAFCVAALIASEFMPVSLLTPIATDLGVTEGRAGQAISISGIFAVITSLSVARVTRSIDRKLVLSAFSVLLILSGIVVTLAPNFVTLMVGRSLLGVAIGGFWGMSTAIIMRLLPEGDVPWGLAMLNAGVAVASTFSAPMGAFLGDLIGWRGAFFVVVPLGLVALVWQWVSMPSLPPRGRASRGNVFALLLRPQVALGMTAILLLFMGQFALFTYLRPYLESVAGYSVNALSLVFLGLGLAGVAGAWVVSKLLARHLYTINIAIPLLMALIALLLIAVTPHHIPVAVLLVAWGFIATAAPVGWGTWLSRVLRNEAEEGGGLQVAVIQLAIALGASYGGLLYDRAGWWGTFTLAAVLLAGSAVAAFAAKVNWAKNL